MKFLVADGHGEWIKFARRDWDEYNGEEDRPDPV